MLIQIQTIDAAGPGPSLFPLPCPPVMDDALGAGSTEGASDAVDTWMGS